MDEMRASTPDERRALKAAVRRAARLAGGAASVQHMTRVSETDLSRYAGPAHAERHCPIDVALEIDREAQSPVILAALAGMLGYRLVRERGGDRAGLDETAVAKVAKEAADVAVAIAAGRADGRLCEADRRAINQEIEEAVKALRDVQAGVMGADRPARDAGNAGDAA